MARQSLGPDLSRMVTQTQLNALPTYVNNGMWITRADLKASFPASADTVGKLARVLDVWGTVRTSLICEYDGKNYYWRPQRTDYAVQSAQRNGAVQLVPLITAPTIVFTDSLSGNLELQLSTVDVWPGCRYDVTAPSSLGLFTMSFTGLLGGLSSLLGGGARKQAVYTADGWRIAP